jgi:hypothetical protein
MPSRHSPSPVPQAGHDVKPSRGRKRTQPVPDDNSSTSEEDVKPLPKRTKSTKSAKPVDSDEFTPDSEEDVKPAKPAPKRRTAPSRTGAGVRGPWSGEEYVQLFDHVMANGAGSKSFAVAVPGRSANQAAMAWR